MEQTVTWYGFDMIPAYITLSEKQLPRSKEQLRLLKACENKPHVLDDYTVDRIIQVYTGQNETLWIPVEQCRKWREQSPNEEQLSDIIQVENSFKNLRSVNDQILALAYCLKKNTIDSVLRKSDIEIALDFLGNIKNDLNLRSNT